jgi:hypothetical protein
MNVLLVLVIQMLNAQTHVALSCVSVTLDLQGMDSLASVSQHFSLVSLLHAEI